MKKLVTKVHKSTLELAKAVTANTSKEYGDLTEDDVDNLAECINILEDLYEVLYDNVYDDSE